MEVPTATSLHDIYDEDAVPVETKRWERLLAKFKELYGKPADFVSRSPGRVNIIGEVSLSNCFHSSAHEYSTLTTPSTKSYQWPLLPILSWPSLSVHQKTNHESE